MDISFEGSVTEKSLQPHTMSESIRRGGRRTGECALPLSQSFVDAGSASCCYRSPARRNR
ncbi:hypothetical protein RHCRD62_20253 [Rhodococcus sp. RD6.2]|jgi:hypothetical protein|nr:hypothetical protein RHCRD62_20253 [Rhodococcus sp. RD6.2]